jgi:hypothetical protein
MATLGTKIYLITHRGKHWNHLRKTLSYITPQDLWRLGLLFYSLLMAVLHRHQCWRQSAHFLPWSLMGGMYASPFFLSKTLAASGDHHSAH